jgi:2-desacetyl-2-hydroxyethyl bacteriochlorophyllide A dehydrogenase
VKAVVWHGPGTITVDDVDDPRPAPGRVVVEVGAVGICGSDVTSYLGRMGVSRPGQIRGHEFAGTVRAATPEDAAWIGRRVTVHPIVACGRCADCRAGRDNLCADQASLGIQLPGGLAELVAVPVANLEPVAPDVDLRAAAGAEPLAQAIHDVELARRDGEITSVLVIGAGSIGLLVVQAARRLGIAQITVLEPNRVRHGLVREHGGGPVVADREQAAELAGPHGFDAVLDIVGTTATRQDALSWTRRGGTAVLVGLHADSSPLPWRDALRRELTVRGANASTRGEFARAAEWINNGEVATPVPPAAPLNAAPDLFAQLAAGTPPTGGKVVLAPAPGEETE